MKNNNSFSSTIIGCICAILCVAILGVTFSLSVSKLTDSNNTVAGIFAGAKNNSVSADTPDKSVDTDDFAADNGNSSQNVDNETHDSSEDTTDTSADVPASPSESSGDSTAPANVDEIVNYFNTCVNKIKPTATKVVKNFEKRTFHEDKTDIPDAIESTAEGMVSSMMGDDTEPIVYGTKEEIETNFIVPEQSYSSKLKSEWVKSATCNENGKNYIIHIKLKDQKNPTAGNGVGAVCDVIETHEVANKVSFVEDFSTFYYDCEITATIDKATEHVTHIVYKTPLLLNMTVNLFGTHTGVIAFTFEKDYTITY